MQYREIIAVCSEIRTKHKKIHCVGRMQNVLMLKLVVHIVTNLPKGVNNHNFCRIRDQWNTYIIHDLRLGPRNAVRSKGTSAISYCFNWKKPKAKSINLMETVSRMQGCSGGWKYPIIIASVLNVAFRLFWFKGECCFPIKPQPAH